MLWPATRAVGKIPFLGCDGLPKTGQDWVRSGLLAATVYIPPNVSQAMELMMKSIATGMHPPERTFNSFEIHTRSRSSQAKVVGGARIVLNRSLKPFAEKLCFLGGRSGSPLRSGSLV